MASHHNWYWHKDPVVPGPAVVFDMDGVLSNANERQHFLRDGRRDWDAFFAACGDDELIDDVAGLLDVLDNDLQIILLTARPITVQSQTLRWLERLGLRWDLLLMRPAGTYLPSRKFKGESVDQLREYGFDLRLAFEDDPRNVEMLRAAGVPCIYIHSGYYDE